MENKPQDTKTPQPNQSVRILKDQMQPYYTNCAMVSTSPMDMTVFFGRYTPINRDSGEQVLAEVYESQIIMTFEQARSLALALAQTLQMIQNSKQTQAQGQSQPQPQPQAQATEAPRPIRPAPPLTPVQQRAAGAMLTKEDLDLELEIPADDYQSTGKSTTIQTPGVNTSRGDRPDMLHT